jgi:hypothetical protein
MQCRTILKDIEDTIPHGSKKPDYADRLKYAFGAQKKIIKHQENLKQVQHMFMFMTTCWQYQLPFKQPVATGSATGSLIPIGNLQGTLQHMPVQINMKSPGNASQTVTYEATLTLKPIDQPQTELRWEQESSRRKTHVSPRTYESSDREKQTLSNMRRSPYFSMDLLKPKAVEQTRYSGDIPIDYKYMEERMKKEKERAEMKQKQEHTEIRLTPPSKEQASQEVDNLLSQVPSH